MNKRQLEVQKAHIRSEKAVIRDLKKVYTQAKKDCEERIKQLAGRTDTENLQTIVYQMEYQKAIKQQLEAILDTLESNQFNTIAEYLEISYEDGYLGTLYDLQGQGIPFIFPLDQDQVVKALQNDIKLSEGLYSHLGEDIKALKKSVRAEVSRGISNGQSWWAVAENIANGMNSPFDKAMFNAIRIARTEGHRVANQAQLDTIDKAKGKGADIVKQWDATLDGRTRDEHREADGQIREIDEYFDVGGEKMKAPGVGGSARNVCNCRCCMLQRARWALDEDELKVLEERAKFFGLDKTADFEDYKKKFIPASKSVDDATSSLILSAIGTPERKMIKQSSSPVKINLNGIKCEATYTQFVFSDGRKFSGRSPEGAFVFEIKNGVKFIFREKMNPKHQTMTPEKAVELWQRVPPEVKALAQKEIQFVDYYNPQDTYWRKQYKNFPHSYATGGDDITFCAYRFNSAKARKV